MATAQLEENAGLQQQRDLHDGGQIRTRKTEQYRAVGPNLVEIYKTKDLKALQFLVVGKMKDAAATEIKKTKQKQNHQNTVSLS